MKKTSICITLFIFLTAGFHTSKAYDGYLFFLNFMNLTSANIQTLAGDKLFQEIFISGAVGATVKVQNVLSGETVIKKLSSTETSFRIEVDRDMGGSNSSTYGGAIIVSADQPISVQANKAVRDSGDGYLAFPISNGSTEFFLASYNSEYNLPSLFTITSVTNGTCMDIVKYNEDGSSQTVNHFSLDANEVFYGQMESDITGFYISTSKPVAVYSGHICVKIPVERDYCDHIVEQILPVTEWGKVHFASNFYGSDWDSGYIIRVVSAKSQNVTLQRINYDQQKNAKMTLPPEVFEIDRGMFYEYKVFGNALGASVVTIECPSTCLVMQYNTGQLQGSTNTMTQSFQTQPDPFMVTVPGIEHYTNDVYFSTGNIYKPLNNGSFAVQIAVDFVTVILKTDNIGFTNYDGLSLPTSDTATLHLKFDYNGTKYSVVSFEVKAGFHRVTTSTKDNFYAVFVYGFGTKQLSGSRPTGYGYLGGYKYAGVADALITTGPWFDMTIPDQSTSTNTSNAPGQFDPSLVTFSDMPYEVGVWNASFCTIYHTDNIIRQKCSEGYRNFFLKYRIPYMEKKLNNTCINTTVSLSLLPFQYSEYTCGNIYLLIQVAGVDETTLTTVSECLNKIDVEITPLQNWMDNYKVDKVIDVSTDPDIQDCNPVHFRNKEMFRLQARGWTCPKNL